MLSKVHEIVTQIFSEGGFAVDGFSVKGKSPCHVKIYVDEESVKIDFIDYYPKATITKQVLFFRPRINIDVLGIVLKKNSGIVKLRNFIDFPFDYEERTS